MPRPGIPISGAMLDGRGDGDDATPGDGCGGSRTCGQGTQDQAAAAIASAGVPVFALKGDCERL